MGTQMAPSYANLFIGRFEVEHIYINNTYAAKVVCYKRYIDNLFFQWKGTKEEAQ